MFRSLLPGLFAVALVQPALALEVERKAEFEALIALHAKVNGVPEALVHRVVVRESRYNARAVGRGGAMGLMQIKTPTARALGYTGGPSGLLDAETNLTYAVRYLAGAYRVAGGNPDRAVSLYASGYYYEAKRRGLAGPMKLRPEPVLQIVASTPAPVQQTAAAKPTIVMPTIATPPSVVLVRETALVDSRILRESTR